MGPTTPLSLLLFLAATILVVLMMSFVELTYLLVVKVPLWSIIGLFLVRMHM